jgi:hypothetical protein
MYDCKDCMEWFARCPCCGLEFCPNCGRQSSDDEEEET